MPGSREYRLEGLLLQERGGPILRMDDGGRWRLQLDPGFERLLGRRVVIDGRRSGFDTIDVRSIAVPGEGPDEFIGPAVR